MMPNPRKHQKSKHQVIKELIPTFVQQSTSIARTMSFDALSEATNLNAMSRRESMDRSDAMKSRSAENIIQHANQNLQNLKLLQEQSGKMCASSRQIYNSHILDAHGGQVLGVRLLPGSRALSPPTIQCATIVRPPSLGHIHSINSSFTKVPPNGEKMKEAADRSNMELNLNFNDGQVKSKNIKGVKLIGMEGGTLRRPSMQVDFGRFLAVMRNYKTIF